MQSKHARGEKWLLTDTEEKLDVMNRTGVFLQTCQSSLCFLPFSDWLRVPEIQYILQRPSISLCGSMELLSSECSAQPENTHMIYLE